MNRRKKQFWLFLGLFTLVLSLTLGGLFLAQSFRKDRGSDPDQLSSQNDVPRITPAEAYQAYQNQEIIILDVRDETSYQTQHIAGAINIPLDQLKTRLGELDQDIWVISYCT